MSGRHRRDETAANMAITARARGTWTRLRRAARDLLWITGDRLCARRLTFGLGHQVGELGWKLRTPAPVGRPGQGTAPDSGPGRQARPGDHPLETGLARGVVRAGAGDEPVPYWPAYLPTPAPDRSPAQVPRPVDPRDRSSRGAVRAGATIPAPGAAPGQAPHAPAVLPPEQPDAAALPPAPEDAAAPLPRPDTPAFPGAGQHPDGQPVVWHRADGTRVVIGWGPKAEIPRPYAQNRVTGAHVIIPGSAPLVPRGYQAFEARRDSAVNTP